MKEYNDLFFDYVDSGSIESAKVFAAKLFPQIQMESLLDVGSGRGGWARSWKEAGCARILAVDGDYVERAKLYVAPDEFQVVDLNQPFDLGRRFDFVQSLEVAEHLRPEGSERFVDCLTKHGDVVLFAAARPGQGGTNHINERPLEFWRDLFRAKGYASFDFIRPATLGDERVEPWYRYNTVLYANQAGRARLSRMILDTEVAAGRPLPEPSPLSWRLRNAVVRALPVSFVTRLAAMNARRRIARMHAR